MPTTFSHLSHVVSESVNTIIYFESGLPKMQMKKVGLLMLQELITVPGGPKRTTSPTKIVEIVANREVRKRC